jgi:acyl carrier protein
LTREKFGDSRTQEAVVAEVIEVTISSRTPEGTPHRCPVCGKDAAVEPSYPGGDSTCPTCGHLLWLFRDRLSRAMGVDATAIRLETSLMGDLGADSLDIVELVMEIEEVFDVTIPDDAADQIKTVQDAIQWIRRLRDEAA